MSKHEQAKQLAIEVAAAKKLVRCDVESTKQQPDGSVRVIVSGALDIDVEGAVGDGHNREDVDNLISNMRLQVDVKAGQVIQQEWLKS